MERYFNSISSAILGFVLLLILSVSACNNQEKVNIEKQNISSAIKKTKSQKSCCSSKPDRFTKNNKGM